MPHVDPRKLTAEQLDAARRWRAPKETRIVLKNADGVVYVSKSPSGHIVGRAYAGKAIRHAWKYSFPTAAALHAYAAKWAAGLAARAMFAADTRARAAAFRHTLEVGDVLYATWGYDQTNVDYYEVTSKNGASMVTLCKINDDRVETGWLQGRSTPRPGAFIGKPFRARVREGNLVRIASYATASPLTFQDVAGARVYDSNHWTAYA